MIFIVFEKCGLSGFEIEGIAACTFNWDGEISGGIAEEPLSF
jgi:hypothetical protein